MPKKQTLSKKRICQTALKIADKEGVKAVSMRRIAKDLKVEAMSLYHHMKNKDEILTAMTDEVFREIKLSSQGKWQDIMTKRAHNERNVLLKHPWAINLINSRKEPGPATLEHHNGVLGILRTQGFSVNLAAHAFALIDSYIYGFVIQELTLAFQQQEEMQDIASKLIKNDAKDNYPYLTELINEQILQPNYAFANEFDFGLELILNGLERLRATNAP